VGFAIDRHSPVPAWQQLASQLRAHIATLAPQDMIPSTQELVKETGLAIGTIQKAVSALKAEGLVYAVSGRGTFKR